MRIRRILKMAMRALGHNKSRAFLTALGVIIGVAAVMMMLSIGGGTQASVTSRISALGTNLLMIQPAFQRSGNIATSSQMGSLTLDDATALQSLTGVQAVAPVISRRSQVIAGSSNVNTSIIGTTPDYKPMMNLSLQRGSFFAQPELDQWDKVAVLGSSVAEQLFPNENPTGKTIEIVSNATRGSFRVLGILAAKGGSGFSNQDDQILIPITTASRLLFGSKSLSQINVQVASTDEMTGVAEQITQLLRVRHDIPATKESDFTILNQEELLSTLSSVALNFTVLLAGIAGISLLVGGIGIMNIMLVSVTERTREIGLRKAIGALKRDVVFQFLIEAVLLSGAGGLLGILFGFLGSLLITALGNTPTVVTPTSILLGFVFSLVVGVFFGFYPAQRAANLKPIEALRYE